MIKKGWREIERETVGAGIRGRVRKEQKRDEERERKGEEEEREAGKRKR